MSRSCTCLTSYIRTDNKQTLFPPYMELWHGTGYCQSCFVCSCLCRQSGCYETLITEVCEEDPFFPPLSLRARQWGPRWEFASDSAPKILTSRSFYNLFKLVKFISLTFYDWLYKSKLTVHGGLVTSRKKCKCKFVTKKLNPSMFYVQCIIWSLAVFFLITISIVTVPSMG